MGESDRGNYNRLKASGNGIHFLMILIVKKINSKMKKKINKKLLEKKHLWRKKNEKKCTY